ncbi:hypothetical protein K491DRAFT_269548 [Lophiostoma macrostomum CBS 122681]|uniref:HAUS augmin-like complex subunit 4 n=1 Tax=Lophiostoma macrostomum CBS 122681 TaxID=1314788 RepID=A0A6A6THN9_9PLEO|nr:hypothetical protein K491DRAFT_269548 [Lophiostoma macrostomum CBS 122681]
MLPPVDPSVLQRNQSFEILYKDLCTRKLNPDGSTRDTKKQRIHDETRRNLTASLTTLYQTEILLATLSTLPSKSHSSELPPDLHATIELTTALLRNQVAESDREILDPDISDFLSSMSTISTALSTQLTTTASHLCTISNPLSPPGIADLPTQAEELKDAATQALPAEIAQQRFNLANLAYEVLSMHRQVLESSIQILEQTMHGSVARHTKTKAELLHSKATLLGLQARIQTLTNPPPAQFVTALRGLKASQASTSAALRDRQVMAKRALELYEKAGEKAMQDIARRAGYLRDEIQRTEGEVRGLEHGEV